jgi:hypothetical protein
MRNRIFNIQPIVTPFKICQSNEQNLYKIRQKDTPLKDSGQGHYSQSAVALPSWWMSPINTDPHG